MVKGMVLFCARVTKTPEDNWQGELFSSAQDFIEFVYGQVTPCTWAERHSRKGLCPLKVVDLRADLEEEKGHAAERDQGKTEPREQPQWPSSF